jgi:tryptophan synthase alpha chain
MAVSLGECFAQLKAEHKKALIPFLTVGDPDLAATEAALLALDQAGANLIELGIPYSDPLADGPVIQAASTRALQQGTTLLDVLALVERLTPKLKAPLILFSYYNPILSLGIEPFLDKIAQAGAKGLVVPDLPLEESDLLMHTAQERGIDVIQLVAPTSPPSRMEKIVKQARGFVYLVSVTGVTGVRREVSSELQPLISRLQKLTDLPVCVGFGISSPEQAQQVVDWGADGVIVGSAFVRKLAEAPPKEQIAEITQFCKDLRKSIDSSLS